MIYDLITSLAEGYSIRDILPGILFTIIVVVFSLSLHESAHAWAAYKLEDHTARNMGRISLNPAKHLDPMGTICMMLFGFGWAKPVLINSRNFKNPRVGMALSALAGPLSNIILSFISVLLWVLMVRFLPVPAMIAEGVGFGGKLLYFLSMLLQYFHILNLYLAVFNLLPIPPLDGSKILFLFLPPKALLFVHNNERIFRYVLIAMLIFGTASSFISLIASLISNGMIWLITLIPGI